MKYWRAILCLLIGGVFVFSGATKVVDVGAFARDIGNYRLLPAAITLPFAAFVPWLEIVCGLAMLVPMYRTAGTASLALLVVIFTLAIAQAMVRGIDISCGCFGSQSGGNLWLSLLRNAALLAALALSLKSYATRTPLPTPQGAD